ncbi:TIGR04452 family lipoprotein [Leptospira wolffii]|uniref:TIGR04452 family lipoprotein n=1 Tax=Leptospira wolffii TaxID=409998 RepID=A0ABV5BTU8_9LEPT|nr:TIGR04452 family lipoprotein [Leptospira wolffii]EPG68086.1 hypothetical protein LEP1GSC061_0779 [Leptospira wolffii serovar Khorat str. Khorat-H2]
MKKKTYLLVLLFALAYGNCLLLDNAGLSDSYTGKEAKKKIKDAALIGDTWSYGLVYGPDSAGSLAVLDQVLVELFSKIDEGKFYERTDVDKCADDVRNFAILLISDASTTTLISSNCSGIKANGAIY